MTPLLEACADDRDILALSIMRMVMAGYVTGDVACWDMAYGGAERLLPPEQACRLVASLTGLIRTVRAHRAGEWQFMPVTCCRVTGDEKAIIALLAAGRRGDAPGLSRVAFDLVGRDGLPVEAAARVASAVIDEIDPAVGAARAGEDAQSRYRRGVGAWHA